MDNRRRSILGLRAEAQQQWRVHAKALKALAGEYGTLRHARLVRKVAYYNGRVSAFNDVLQLAVDSPANSG